MKKLSKYVSILVITIGFAACAKNDTPTDSADLQVSQSGTLHVGQPVTFTLPSVSASSTVNWSVTPNQATISSNGNTASVSFLAAGKYSVTGTSGSAKSTSSITVDSAKYVPPTGGTGGTTSPIVAFTANEQLNITVRKVDSSAGSTLIFTAQTAGTYTCANNFLLVAPSMTATSFSVDVTGVYVPVGAACSNGSIKATATIGSQNPFPAGTSQLIINFNGTKYSGTIVKTGNSYSINWGYTSGVVVSPLAL